MTLAEFKKQRNELIAKLAVLAVEINEQCKYLASCEATGRAGWIHCEVIETFNFKAYKYSYLVKEILHPFTTLRPEHKMDHDGKPNQYELIIADLQHTYDEMSKFLEIQE